MVGVEDLRKAKTTRKFMVTVLVCFSSTAGNAFKNAVRRILRKKLNHHRPKSRRLHELKGTRTSFEVHTDRSRKIPE